MAVFVRNEQSESDNVPVLSTVTPPPFSAAFALAHQPTNQWINPLVLFEPVTWTNVHVHEGTATQGSYCRVHDGNTTAITI